MKTLVFISLLASMAALLVAIKARQEDRLKAKKSVNLLIDAMNRELGK